MGGETRRLGRQPHRDDQGDQIFATTDPIAGRVRKIERAAGEYLSCPGAERELFTRGAAPGGVTAAYRARTKK
jgi:hypothetical protein